MHKMVKVNQQLADPPSESELNASELHVNAVMTGDEMAAPDKEEWQDKESKILEYCLQSTSVNVGAVLRLCLLTSRSSFALELNRQKASLEGLVLTRGLGLLSVSRSRKPRTLLQPVKRLSLKFKPSPLEWKQDMLAYLLTKNSEIAGKVKDFRKEINKRRSKVSKADTKIDPENVYMLKMQRARQYDKSGPTSPNLLSYTRSKLPYKRENRLKKDVSGPYFVSGTSLPTRIFVIHCILVIQRGVRMWKNNVKLKGVQIIQTWFRQQETERVFLRKKFEKFRKMYFKEKLTNWILLIGKKRREKRKKYDYNRVDYSLYLPWIRTIQRLVKGFLTRKKVIPWVKSLAKIRAKRMTRRYQVVKQWNWTQGLGVEGKLISTAVSIEEQVSNSLELLQQGKSVKGFVSEKEVLEHLGSLEKAEKTERRQQLWVCRSERLAVMTRLDRLTLTTYNGDISGRL